MKVFDLHCDTIGMLEEKGGDLINTNRHLSLDRVDAFEAYTQTFALFLPDERRGAEAIRKYESMLACFRQQMEHHSDKIAQVRTGVELEVVLESGRTAAILSVEGGSALAGNFSRIETLARDGVRFLTLTWNGANELAGGCLEPGPLTPFGREAVPELLRHGIVPDVSHLSDEALDDVLSLTAGPIVATHSNARSICHVPRNLRDDQFKEIARRGGLVGINYCVYFLREKDSEHVNFSDILRHVEHFLALGGENTLALGSDFDGCDVPKLLGGVEKVANLYNFMLESIADKALVDRMFFENGRRFCLENFV